MFKKIAKGSLSLITLLFFVFLTLLALGDYLYPDTINHWVGEEVPGVLCFSYVETDKAEETSDAFAMSQTNEGKILAFGFLPVKEVQVNSYEKTNVICGGELFGVRLQTKGLLVTGLGQVETADGALSPGETAGIQKGDVILKANDIPLDSAASFAKLLSKSGGNALVLELERGGNTQKISLTPAKSLDNSGYKAGVWVRDGAAGIGTVTFRDAQSGAFAGLGHAICDGETGVPFPLGTGSVCLARVESITKGENGTPGEIRGRLENSTIGTLSANGTTGVFGTLEKGCFPAERGVPIALKNEVHTGKADIVCTLDSGGKKEYEIEIEEIIALDRESKNFVLHITDPNLLQKTGGIVQGMSGSPILQDGKLVGAVTHVLVGDPTRGYGIFIENMLDSVPAS